MGDVSLVNKRCEHNTVKGVALRGVVTKTALLGLFKYDMIQKECLACGDFFLSDLKGRRLLN